MAKQKNTGKVMPVQPIWLCREEAKRYLGCSDRFLKTLRDNALVRFSQYGSKMFWYELKSIETFLEKNRIH